MLKLKAIICKQREQLMNSLIKPACFLFQINIQNEAPIPLLLKIKTVFMVSSLMVSQGFTQIIKAFYGTSEKRKPCEKSDC